jgi:hypothetical protein
MGEGVEGRQKEDMLCLFISNQFGVSMKRVGIKWDQGRWE